MAFRTVELCSRSINLQSKDHLAFLWERARRKGDEKKKCASPQVSSVHIGLYFDLSPGELTFVGALPPTPGAIFPADDATAYDFSLKQSQFRAIHASPPPANPPKSIPIFSTAES